MLTLLLNRLSRRSGEPREPVDRFTWTVVAVEVLVILTGIVILLGA